MKSKREVQNELEQTRSELWKAREKLADSQKEREASVNNLAADVIAALGLSDSYPDVERQTKIPQRVYNHPFPVPDGARVDYTGNYSGMAYWSGWLEQTQTVTDPGSKLFIADVREAARGARGAEALKRIQDAVKAAKR